MLVNGIAGAVLEAGKHLTREPKASANRKREAERTRQRRARAMTKSNFEKLAKAPLFARPPRPDEGASPITGYGAVRAADGRSARRTGRTVQFATVVSPEFKRWLKVKAAATRQVAGGAARRHEGGLHRKIRRRIAMLSLLKRKPKTPSRPSRLRWRTPRPVPEAEPAAKP